MVCMAVGSLNKTGLITQTTVFLKQSAACQVLCNNRDVKGTDINTSDEHADKDSVSSRIDVTNNISTQKINTCLTNNFLDIY